MEEQDFKEIYKDISSLSSLKKLWRFLSRRRKKQSYFLLFSMILSGSLELINLSLLVPFLYTLQNKGEVNTISESKIGLSITNIILINNINTIASLFIFTIFISVLARLFVLWYGGALTARIGSDLGSQAYLNVLNQPYEYHIQINSSKLITTINSHTDSVIGALIALMLLITSTVVVTFILIGLLLINPLGATISLFTFAILYLIVGFWSRNSLRKNSVSVSNARNQQLKAIQEGLGAIREIILDHTQIEYFKIFSESSFILRTKTAFNQFLAGFPRYMLELIGLTTISILAIIISTNPNFKNYTIPILGTIALAAQRLLPAMQQIYSGWANLNAANISFAFLNELLELKGQKHFENKKAIKLRKSINFNSISFKYSSKGRKYIFQNLNFKINAGSRLGIVGPSGSGKSTFVDLIMGLLRPNEGDIIIDGNKLFNDKNNSFLIAWRSTIAHVPQHIFLSDDSISANIAFGIPESKRNKKLIIEASRKAQLYDYIINLPKGLNTKVGERGIRLSGGQRQRIGIARALYKKSSVVILDEATSALDSENESYVMDAIEKISRKVTIIIIAHRISTLKKCDNIISIKNGNIQYLDNSNI